MTPKEKAFKLAIDKYYNLNCISTIEDAKQCALIAVDEVLKIPYLLKKETWFYKEVKQEIEKL